MQTLHPSIIPGAYKYDPELLPEDEFRARIDRLKETMKEADLAATLVYGDAREHAALAYYSNFIPRNRWGLVMLPKSGDPRLLASVAARSVPAQRPMTWVADLQSGWDFQKSFDPWIAALESKGGKLGTVGFDLVQPPLYEAITSGAQKHGYTLCPIDQSVDGFLEGKRPRELALLRKANAIVGKAAAAWIDAWTTEKSALGAALKAERVARSSSAQDVRVLVSTDGGETLEPYQNGIEAEAGTKTTLGYIAVKYMGFWSDRFLTLSDGTGAALTAAKKGLAAMIKVAHAGVTGGQLHAAMQAELGQLSMHPVLDGSVGQPIGLSLHGRTQFVRDSTHPLKDGCVYSLHAGASGKNEHAIVSAMILVGSKEVEVLSTESRGAPIK